MSVCFLTRATCKNVLQNLILWATACWAHAQPPFRQSSRLGLQCTTRRESCCCYHSTVHWHGVLGSGLVFSSNFRIAGLQLRIRAPGQGCSVHGTGPPTNDLPRRSKAASRALRAESGESATAGSALDIVDKGRYACSSRVRQGQELDRCHTAARGMMLRNPLECVRSACNPLGGQRIRVPAVGETTWPWRWVT